MSAGRAEFSRAQAAGRVYLSRLLVSVAREDCELDYRVKIGKHSKKVINCVGGGCLGDTNLAESCLGHLHPVAPTGLPTGAGPVLNG